MKKFIPLMLLLSATLASCGTPAILADADHDYFVTGQFAGWENAPTALEEDGVTLKYLMEAISIADERVESVKSQFRSPEFLYVKAIVLSDELAVWSETYTRIEGGTAETFNGNLTVKVQQIDIDAEVPVPNYWAQNPESGIVNNLTPETLYLPPFFEEAQWEGSGTWASNPVALEAGNYLLVFGSQVFSGDELAEVFMGLIPVEVVA
jgi:hypothetical protein